MTTREKIDQVLGVSCGKSMDQMLDELELDEKSVHDTLDGFDATLQGAVKRIDEKALELQKGVGDGALAIQDMTMSLKEIEGLIAEAKAIFLHIKENIISTDLVDSELIQGAAKFLEAMHVNIAEFISVYRQKAKFVEKIKLMIFQQQQKIDLMNLKHKHDLELIEAKQKPAEGQVVEADNLMSFNTDDIAKMIDQGGFEDLDDEDEEDREEEDDEDGDEDGDGGARRKTAKTARTAG